MKEDPYVSKLRIGSYDVFLEGKNPDAAGRVVLVRNYESSAEVCRAVNAVLSRGVKDDGFLAADADELVGEVNKLGSLAELTGLSALVEDAKSNPKSGRLSDARLFQADSKGNVYASKSLHPSAYAACQSFPEKAQRVSGDFSKRNMPDLLL